jgi:hypothetical protein
VYSEGARQQQRSDQIGGAHHVKSVSIARQVRTMKAEPELYTEVEAPCPSACPLYSPVVARGSAHNMTSSHESRAETTLST